MTIILSENDLRRLFPHANEDVMQSVSAEWNTTLARYGINDTRKRLLSFLAETAEETNNWQSMVEGGNAEVYKGRGLIQLTGHANYQQIGAKLARDFPDAGLTFDLVGNPGLAAMPPYVLKTAVAWWDVNGVNKICDTGTFLQVSLKVNGRNPSTGLPNGWARRPAGIGPNHQSARKHHRPGGGTKRRDKSSARNRGDRLDGQRAADDVEKSRL